MKIFEATKFIRKYIRDRYNPFIYSLLYCYLRTSFFDKRSGKYAHFKGEIVGTYCYYKGDREYLAVVVDKTTYEVSITNFIKYVRNNYYLYNFLVETFGNLDILSTLFGNYELHEIRKLIDFMKKYNLKSPDLVLKTQLEILTIVTYGKIGDDWEFLFNKLCLL